MADVDVMLIGHGDPFHKAPFESRSLSDRTSRGDTCFAGYLGSGVVARLAGAARVVAAVATWKREWPGPWRGSRAEVKIPVAGKREAST